MNEVDLQLFQKRTVFITEKVTTEEIKSAFQMFQFDSRIILMVFVCVNKKEKHQEN